MKFEFKKTAAECGDARQQLNEQRESDRRIPERDQGREEAGIRLDDVLEEPEGTSPACPSSGFALGDEALGSGEPSPNSHLPLVILPQLAGREDRRDVDPDDEPEPRSHRPGEQEAGPTGLPEMVRSHGRIEQPIEHRASLIAGDVRAHPRSTARAAPGGDRLPGTLAASPSGRDQ